MKKHSEPQGNGSSPKEGVLYARVSSGRQEAEGYSIPAQIKLLKDYAEEKGIDTIQEFIEAETAKKAGRTEFVKMVNFLRKTKTCRIVICEKTDRLYRNFKDYVILDDLDIEIHLVKENEVLSKQSRSHQKLIHEIKVVLARNYILNLAEETTKGFTEKAAQGYWPCMAPVGYKNVAGPENKRIIIRDPETAPVVTKIFQLYGTGKYSIQDLTKIAVADGLRFKRSGRPVIRATIHKVLQNLIYTGSFEFKGKVYPGKHEPLISLELYNRVQEVLHGRAILKLRKSVHDFQFARLIRCGHCGCALVGQIQKKRYVYYHCSENKGKCPEPYVREETLDQVFSNVLTELRFDQDCLDFVRQAMKASHEEEREFHSKAITRLQNEYNRLDNRLHKMYEDKLDGRINAEYYDAKAREYRTELQGIEKDLARHREADQNYLDEGIKLLELASRARELYLQRSSNEKRQLLDFLCSNSVWKNGELTVNFRKPFDSIVDMNREMLAEKQLNPQFFAEGLRKGE